MPKLWYYMGLCVINLNKQKYHDNVKGSYESDVYFKKHSFENEIQYGKNTGRQSLKRFQLAENGDQLSKMNKLMRDYEQ